MKKILLLICTIVISLTIVSCSADSNNAQGASEGEVITIQLTTDTFAPIFSDNNQRDQNIVLEISEDSALDSVLVFVTAVNASTLVAERELNRGEQLAFPVSKKAGTYTIHAKAIGSDDEGVFLITEINK